MTRLLIFAAGIVVGVLAAMKLTWSREPVEPADLDYMCPNCVTPWKCNGPHEPAWREEVPVGWQW